MIFQEYRFDKEEIKERLRIARTGAKYSQQEFNKAIKLKEGVHTDKNFGRATTSNWEQTGKSIPSIKDMCTICNLLQIDMDTMLGRTDIASKDRAELAKITHLSEEAISFLDKNEEYAKFADDMLTYARMGEMMNRIKQLSYMSVMNDVMVTAFTPDLIKKINEAFDEYYYSGFPMDLSQKEFEAFLDKKIKDPVEKLEACFLEDGYNFVLNSVENYGYLDFATKRQILIEVIAEISFDYNMGVKSTELSRHRISEMMNDMVGEIIQKETDRIHENMRKNAEMILARKSK